ncbi:MAG: nitrilase-related carbon-nitrogen hydrolase [Planctomycetota bacterium]|jgi:predicted amidohydrolase
MKIGFVQFAPQLGDVDATIRLLDTLCKEFEPADLVVLPELSNSGYNFASIEHARSTAEDARDGAFVQYLLSLSERHDQYIVAGVNERDSESSELYNTAVLIGPKGHIGRYRKLHLFKNEKDFFQPGNLGLPVFDLGVCRLGMLVCFDWIFPEAWRVLALRGADIICHPANLVLPGFAQKSIPVHALMNRIFVVTANRIGREGDLTFTGLSTIADPNGDVLIQASEAGTQVSIVDVDISLARDKMVTPRNHVLNDRRPEEYADLIE